MLKRKYRDKKGGSGLGISTVEEKVEKEEGERHGRSALVG